MTLSRRSGFTLVEILVVVAIIATIMAIVIPNLFRMLTNSKRVICITNLRSIERAVEQFVIDNKVSAGATLSAGQEAQVYSDYIRSGKPKCPSGGTYTINPIDADPQVECSHGADEGHKL